VLVGAGDARHVVGARGRGVERVHDTLRVAGRARGEEDHPWPVAVGLLPTDILPVGGAGDRLEERDGAVGELAGEAVVLAGGHDDEGRVAEHLERDTYVRGPAAPVEHDQRRADAQRRVVADHRVDRVAGHEYDAGVRADVACGQVCHRAVHASDERGVRELLLVVGDGERVRLPLRGGFEAVGEPAVVPPALGAVRRRQ
jgi:hypothetical protein